MSRNMNVLHDMAAAARPTSDDDWGSARQIAAQNAFCTAVEEALGSDSAEMRHWDDWSMKATSDEMIDEALRLLEGTSPYFARRVEG